MGRMKIEANRFMKRQALKAQHREFVKKQKEQTEAVVNLTAARLLLREYVDFFGPDKKQDEGSMENLRQRTLDFLDGKKPAVAERPESNGL